MGPAEHCGPQSQRQCPQHRQGPIALLTRSTRKIGIRFKRIADIIGNAHLRQRHLGRACLARVRVGVETFGQNDLVVLCSDGCKRCLAGHGGRIARCGADESPGKPYGSNRGVLCTMGVAT